MERIMTFDPRDWTEATVSTTRPLFQPVAALAGPVRLRNLRNAAVQASMERFAAPLFSTYPGTKDRIAALDKQAAGMAAPAATPQAQGWTDIKGVFPTRDYYRRHPIV